MPRGRTAKVLTRQWRADGDAGAAGRRPDELIVEEPLAIHLDGTLVATTMRTPGHDFELAVGFCHAEGMLGDQPLPALRCRYCSPTGRPVETEFNVVEVDTGGLAPPPQPRLGPTSSSCGICGSTSIDALRERLHPLRDPWRPEPDLLASIPDRVRRAQALFNATGAVHAAATFDPAGSIGVVREDIGRHNAVDKIVGRLLLDQRLPAYPDSAGVPPQGLFVSGRASFEMVQKAWAGGFSAVVAVSAPSSLAVETARAAGLTLAGFARDDRLNLYT